MLATLRYILSHPGNQGAKVRAVARYLSWQLKARTRRGPFVHRWIADVRFLVRRGETGLTGNIYCGLHEFVEMAFVLHAAREGDLFVDVGANAGSYTLLAAGVRGCSAIAVEPVPSTHARLVSNVRLNSLEDRVECLNVGLSDKPGELAFVVDGDTVSRVATPGDQPGSVATVPVRTLAEIVGGRAPALMKIDVEGYELPVLRGGERVLERPSLHSIVVETNGSGVRYGHRDEEVVELLGRHGFHPCDYDPVSRRLGRLERPDRSAGNTLFVRDFGRVQSLVANAPPVSFGRLRI